MSTQRFGIVGAGLIADVVAQAIHQAQGAELVAIASRRVDTAREFASRHAIRQVHETWQQLLTDDTVDAVYVATPTSVREEICVAAANAGKHVLGDKPFASHPSLQRITQATRANDVAFMDATHFSHHPRTQQLRATLRDTVGLPHVVRTSFFFPLTDRSNIRLDPSKEPTGAVGDMGWYSMRAITEYLLPGASIDDISDPATVSTVSGSIVRDPQTHAVIRGTGVIAFREGPSSTFDFGYDSGVCLMDLDIIGELGALRLEDFVLDWHSGFAFQRPDHVVGFTKRSGLQSAEEIEFIAAESPRPQAVQMIESFVALANSSDADRHQESIRISEQTQFLVDRFWQAVTENQG